MLLLVVFAFSMFLSAGLLFLVEPMVAKMVLPLLGGTPAVWNTSLVFYQATLLAGYLYAWAAAKWLGRRTQIAVHLVLAVACFAALPPRILAGWEPPAQSNPAWALLGVLGLAVGLPFFLLASSTPILQRWFAQSGHRSAHDPYFLYAASNAGSLIGLLGYPLLMEPALRLRTQAHLWSCGYVGFVVMAAICGACVWNAAGETAAPAATSAPEQSADRVELRSRARWVALAFVPSALMIGATTALTTDVPAIPLLWVLPLAVYLLSFILVFARRQLISHAMLLRRLPIILLLAILPSISKINVPFWGLLLLYLTALFAIGMVCHGELARSRPAPRHLTEFYLWISCGGVLGGIFSSLLAPILFSSVAELPLVLIFAAFLRPGATTATQDSGRLRRNDWLAPGLLCVTMVAVIEVVEHLVRRESHEVMGAIYVLVFGYSMLWCLSFGKRRLRFALGIAVLAAASSLYHGAYGQLLFRGRNFFGVLRVANDPEGKIRYLFHGATVHGIQSLDSAKSREPLAYYTRSGPAGSVLRSLDGKALPGAGGGIRKANWAVIGLGAGSMACYRQPGESLTFYEIDPAVRDLASDPGYFTFLSQCAPDARIILGDARLKLRDAPDGSYDLIVLDAFSGDTIPMHLLTREAMALYIRKLAPGGMLAFHISNMHLRLAEPVAALARDAGLVCLMDTDLELTPAQAAQGKRASQWVAMARTRADLGALGSDPRWQAIPRVAGTPVWTDDYSSLLPVIKWSER